MPVKIHSQRLPIRFLFISVVFIHLNLSVITLFFLFYPFIPPVAALCQRFRHCGKQFSVRVAVVVLVKYPSLECDRMVFYKLFLSRCLIFLKMFTGLGCPKLLWEGIEKSYATMCELSRRLGIRRHRTKFLDVQKST